MRYPAACELCDYWDGKRCGIRNNPALCEFLSGYEEEFEEESGEEEFEEGLEEELEEELETGVKNIPAHDTEIRCIADSYYQIQKLRISMSNRLSAISRGVDSPGPGTELLKGWCDKLLELEEECTKYAKDYLRSHPAWHWLKHVKGVGPRLALRLLPYIDITKAETISALWRYCGFGVVDGKAERATKGEKLHYNKKVKTTLYLIGTSMLKAKSSFTRIYYAEKERQKQLNPGLTPLHIHYRALRKMLKVFLACLWVEWRTALGLPTRKPYVIEYLGHTTVYDPWEFVDKAQSKARR